MNIVWGSIMACIGGLFCIAALASIVMRHDVPVYHWLADKARLLWKGGVHYFFMVVGALITTLGTLWACGIIWMN